MRPQPEWPPAWRLLLASLASDPPGENTVPPAMTPADWDALCATCRRHGLLPLVSQFLGQLPSGAVPSGQRMRFRDAAAAYTLRSLQMRAEMNRLVAALAACGVPVIPFKGPVLAEQAYGEIGLRVYDDLDFLVPEGQVAAAVKIIAGQGYVEPAEIGLWGMEKLMEVTNEVVLRHASQSWLVEVHWNFAKPWHRCKFSFDDLWLGVDPYAVNNRLDDTTTLLQLCVHGTSHYWDKLKWVVDVERFVRSVPQLDWDGLFRRAETIGCNRALLLGLFLANDCFDLPLPSTVLRRFQACGPLPWLKQFVVTGWQLSGEHKRSLLMRMIFILRCRDSLTDRLMGIWSFVTQRRP